MCDSSGMSLPPAAGIRARARAEMIAEIKRIARDRLAGDGPDLSLRAVARDLGVVSSAVYRYFPSRDALLTALIIDGYDSLGAAVEQAEAGVPRRELGTRWLTVGRTIRRWALEQPHEYALLYGSPVPGYAAPRDTVGPASRPVVVLVGILRDGVAGGQLAASDRMSRAVRTDLETLVRAPEFAGLPAAVLARGMTAWAQLFGALNFELFGRYGEAIRDPEAFFEHQLRAMGGYVGLL
jgi:AcrR family transcriptional regulator